MPRPTVEVDARPARASDLQHTAALHDLALPHGFFAQLGPQFLARYHETFMASPHGVARVAVVDTSIVGFVVGPTDSTTHYRWVARHRGAHLAWAALVALIRRPHLWAPFFRTRLTRYVRSLQRLLRRQVATTASHPSDSARPPKDVAVLTHVAVAPTHRGQRVGSALVDAFTGECVAAGAPEVRLITDSTTGGRDFYKRLGWTEVTERKASDGSLVVEFRHDLTEDSPR